MEKLLVVIALFLFFKFSLSPVQALTGITRPAGDVSVEWNSTGTSHYTELTSTNDIVTQPTTPDTSDYVDNNNTQALVDHYSMDNSITDVDTVSAIDVWLYGFSDKGGNITIDLYWDGSFQQSGSAAVNNSNDWTGAGWASDSFTGLSLTQTQLDSLEIAITGTQGGRTYYVAALYAEATYTEAPTVAISITTDGSVDFGYQALDSTIDTTSGGVNDVETISVDSGPADLDIRSSTFSDGSNTWSLSSTNGTDQVKWDFSLNGTNWTNFAVADTLYTFDTNVSQGATRDLYLRLTMPTSTSSYNQHESTVTIVATSP